MGLYLTDYVKDGKTWYFANDDMNKTIRHAYEHLKEVNPVMPMHQTICLIPSEKTVATVFKDSKSKRYYVWYVNADELHPIYANGRIGNALAPRFMMVIGNRTAGFTVQGTFPTMSKAQDFAKAYLIKHPKANKCYISRTIPENIVKTIKITSSKGGVEWDVNSNDVGYRPPYWKPEFEPAKR